jgi:hypothetical protein
VFASGLSTPYPYLWSLPARTLDPGMRRLERLLAGPAAPTWVVDYSGVNSWDLDADGGLRTLLAERYDVAGEICGRPVHLRTDAPRPRLPDVDCPEPPL